MKVSKASGYLDPEFQHFGGYEIQARQALENILQDLERRQEHHPCPFFSARIPRHSSAQTISCLNRKIQTPNLSFQYPNLNTKPIYVGEELRVYQNCLHLTL